MHPRILLFSGILLVVLVVSFTHGQNTGTADQSTAGHSTHGHSTHGHSTHGHSTAGQTTVASTTQESESDETTKKPTSKKSKSTTKAPESSESDETTKKPTSKKSKSTTKAPESSESDETTKKPTSKKSKSTTKAPESSESDETTKKPTSKKSKSTTKAPESSESDETTKKSTKSPKKTTKKKKNNYGSYGSSYGSKNKYKGYGKGDDDDSYEVVGEYGNDPSKDGTDLADFGPIKDNKKSMLSSLDVWISSANDWDKDKKDKGGYNGDQDSYKGSRGKRSYKKIRFPVKRVQNYRKFPIKRFPPLISIFPWVPIFYDKLTYQTIIFSPSGGLYIIPPLINFYGQRFAVAQLIKWGYASLVSSGAPVGPGVDVAPLVQPPPPAGGAVAGGGVVPGGSAASGVTYDSNKGRFTGGIKTDFRDFKPRYSQTIEEGGDNYGSSGRSNYGSDSNYGGTRNQQIYPQGGPQNAGRFNQ